MWMVFFGVSYNIRDKEHIKADFLVNKLFVGRRQLSINIFKNIVILFFCIVVIIEGCKLCFLELKTQRMLISLAVPISIISMVIPLSFAFSAFHVILDLLGLRKRRNK